jgi:hypothetical protein
MVSPDFWGTEDGDAKRLGGPGKSRGVIRWTSAGDAMPRDESWVPVRGLTSVLRAASSPQQSAPRLLGPAQSPVPSSLGLRFIAPRSRAIQGTCPNGRHAGDQGTPHLPSLALHLPPTLAWPPTFPVPPWLLRWGRGIWDQSGQCLECSARFARSKGGVRPWREGGGRGVY